MSCKRILVDPESPQAEAIGEATMALTLGGVVAVPTETVYGLAANALDPEAVAGIFAAKGRPAHNPLIVHVLDEADARALAADWPEAATRLAEAFWPGPLTLVLSKTEAVPDIVTGGGSTVAVRVPSHRVMQSLLLCTGFPLAAPSANPSNRVSATTADHVERGLGDRIDLILDGGPTPGGLESTVIDVTGETPRLLRPGPIGVAELESVLQTKVVVPWAKHADESEVLRSPGMMARHYAPSVPLECVAKGEERVTQLVGEGWRVGWITLNSAVTAHAQVEVILLPSSAAEYAARLYAALHELEARGVERIVVDLPPDEPDWHAVHDRLRRASST